MKKSNNQKDLLKLEFDTYLNSEKEAQKATDKFWEYVDFDSEKAQNYLDRAELIHEKMEKQVKIACEAFKMEFNDFIEQLNNYSENK